MGSGDVVLSYSAIAVIGVLLSSLVVGISVLAGAVALLYRQVLKERDRTLDERNRVLEERDARMVDIWRDMDEKETRIVALEGALDRWQKLAADATAGWREATADVRQRQG